MEAVFNILRFYMRGQGAADSANKPVLQRTAFPAEGVPDKTAILSKLDICLPRDARGMLQPLLFENFPK